MSIGGAIAADSGALEDFDESLLPTEKHAPSSDTRELRYMDCSVKSFLIYYNERPALVKIAKRGHGVKTLSMGLTTGEHCRFFEVNETVKALTTISSSLQVQGKLQMRRI